MGVFSLIVKFEVMCFLVYVLVFAYMYRLCV